jgi:hypothetical protein
MNRFKLFMVQQAVALVVGLCLIVPILGVYILRRILALCSVRLKREQRRRIHGENKNANKRQ